MKRFTQSARHAVRGIRETWKHERNFRIQVLAALLVIAAGIALQLAWSEWLFITIAILLVLGAELLNTSLERLADLLSPGHSEAARRAKDTMAGAVLLQAFGAILIGCGVLLHRIL